MQPHIRYTGAFPPVRVSDTCWIQLQENRSIRLADNDRLKIDPLLAGNVIFGE